MSAYVMELGPGGSVRIRHRLAVRRRVKSARQKTNDPLAGKLCPAGNSLDQRVHRSLRDSVAELNWG